jgi:integrase/recombinase XerD
MGGLRAWGTEGEHRATRARESSDARSDSPPMRRRRPRRRFPPEVLANAEVLALLGACGDHLTGVRNRALLALLYRGGLRLGEAIQLRPKDLDLENGAVRVLYGKGGHSRTVGIDPGAAALVRAWLAARGRWAHLPPTAPVFCTAWGRPLAQGYVRRLLPQLAQKAGILKRVHAHGLRHTHAAQLREEGLDIGIISKQLGHRSIATTARYLDHICPLAVVEAMRGRVW